MPDEFELSETPEKPESHKERVVGLIIAAIAVVLAIVTHVGNETNNDKILAHVDASDQFAFYQAKKAHLAQLELTIDRVKLDYDHLSPASQAQADKLIVGYEAESKHLTDDCTIIKKKGDDLMEESHVLEAKARFIELGEIALQIAVVVCSITILTEQRLFVQMGIGAALIGVLFALWGIFVGR